MSHRFSLLRDGIDLRDTLGARSHAVPRRAGVA